MEPKLSAQIQFEEYEQVRKSGVTNMMDLSMVSALTGMTREEVMWIICHYSELKEKFE